MCTAMPLLVAIETNIYEAQRVNLELFTKFNRGKLLNYVLNRVTTACEFGLLYIYKYIFASLCRYQKWLLQVSYSFLCTCECNMISDWITSEICESIFCDILLETPGHEQSHL